MLHPRGNPLEHDADFVIERVPLVGSVEDAIEEIQSVAKALDDGHASRPPVTDPGSPRAVTPEAQKHAHVHAEHRARQHVIPRQTSTTWPASARA